MNTLQIVDRYSQITKSYLKNNSVSYLILYVTSRCNLKCKMCFYADSLNSTTGDGLTLSELKKVSKGVPYLMQLTLTGGEPFLREDLAEIIEIFYKNSGVRSFTIPTNGTYTEKINQVLIRVLKSCPAASFRISLSLDGPKKIHNEIRGSKLAFDNLVKSYRMLKKLQEKYRNLILTLSGVISSFNLPYAKKLIDLYFYKFPADDYTIQFVRGNPREKKAKDFNHLKYLEIVNYLERKKRKYFHHVPLTQSMIRLLTSGSRRAVAKAIATNAFQFPCLAGKRLVILYNTGILAPCEILPPKFNYGNIRQFDYNIQKAVDSPQGKKIYKYIVRSKCHCTFECAIAASLFYSPAQLLKTCLTF